jgi:hypothetical protein
VGALAELLATPDVIRAIGAVLPQATAERALKIIREDVGTVGAAGETMTQKLESASPDTRHEPACGKSE